MHPRTPWPKGREARARSALAEVSVLPHLPGSTSPGEGKMAWPCKRCESLVKEMMDAQ